jgi:hypothetical protein
MRIWISIPVGLALLVPTLSTPARSQEPVWGSEGALLCDDAQVEQSMATTDGGTLVAVQNSCLRVLKTDQWGAVWPGAWEPCGVAVAEPCGFTTGVSLLPDASGGAFVTYTKLGNAWHVYTTHIGADGNRAPTWPAAGLQLTSQAFSGVPVSVPDGNGGVIVVVYDEDGLYWIAQRVASDGTLLWGKDGVVRHDPSVVGVAMVSDGSGGALIAMSVEVDPGDRDLYVQRIDGDGAIASGWPAGGVSVASGPGYQSWGSELRGISDDSGGAIFVWGDSPDGSTDSWDLYATRITGSGEVLWGENGLPLSVAEGFQGRAALASDAKGGAYFVWTSEEVLGDTDVYLQRVSKQGQYRMDDGGLLLAGGSESQDDPSVLGDGKGGAFVTWRVGPPNQAPWRLLLQRVRHTGMPWQGWPENGVEITDSAGVTLARSVRDGSGGVVVSFREWSDELRAQRYDGDASVVAAPVLPDGDLTLRVTSANPIGSAASFELGGRAAGPVEVEVFDSAGRRIRVLDGGSSGWVGSRSLRWDLRDDTGRAVASGVYFLRATSGGRSARGRVVVLR